MDVLQRAKDLVSYNRFIADDITSIIDPLTRYFGIKKFGYRRFLPDGTSMGLCNNLDWTEYLCANHLDKTISRDDEEIKQVLTTTNSLNFRAGVPKKADAFFHALYDLDMWNTIVLYSKGQHYIEAYFFIADRNNPHILDFYINNISLLKRFTEYFSEKGADLIGDTNTKDFFFKTISPDIFEDNNTDKLHAVSDFINHTPITQFSIRRKGSVINLSRRENECLYHLSQGLTMKKTAKLLELSPRTIEFYIKNIKHKTGLTKQSELVRAYAESKNPIIGLHSREA